MVVWINNPFDPLPGEGGRPLRYWLLCRALAAAGHSVVWWSSDFHHLRKCRREVPPAYEAEGFRIRLVATSPYFSNVGLRRWRSHARYADSWAKDAARAVDSRELPAPDCILVSQPPLGLYDAAASMRGCWGSRVVVDVQDAWPEMFYLLLPRPLRFLGRAVFCGLHAAAERAYRGADAVAVVSARYARLVGESGRAGEPRVFRLGCPLLSRAPRAAREGGAVRLCYVGNLGSSYDIRTMVLGVFELAAEGRRVTLDVAGDGPLRTWVAEAAARPESPVTFHGYLTDAELRACMAGCDVGVVPMKGESCVAVPNKVVDYASAGLAVMNGLVGETQELLRQYDAGVWYEPGNVSSFKQAALGYLDAPARLATQQAGALRLAEELFDAEKIYPEMARWLAARGGAQGRAPLAEAESPR